jgi:hypothetical protein
MHRQQREAIMAHERKKAGVRTEHSSRERKKDFDQPVVGSVTPEKGHATSNFTDGDIAGADHKHDDTGHLKRHPPVSEPRRRTTKNPE